MAKPVALLPGIILAISAVLISPGGNLAYADAKPITPITDDELLPPPEQQLTDNEIEAASYEEPAKTESMAEIPSEIPSIAGKYGMDYFFIFYGPSVGQPAAYQPSPTGELDRQRPIFLKNFLSLTYGITEEVSISGTAFWSWRPVKGQDLVLRDPYIRLAHHSIISSGQFNLYADARVHFAISKPSRNADLLGGFQTFQIATYQVGNTGLMLGTYSSLRYNLYGKQGMGTDLELYLGPNISMQVGRNVALTVLYEMGAAHIFGASTFDLTNDGTDLQPGITWEIRPGLIFSPYLNIYTGDKISLNSTSLGMTLNWQIF